MKTKHDVSGIILTAGLDLDDKYTCTLQEVDGTMCLCLHNHEEHSGLHYSKMDADSLVAAIPVSRIIRLLAERPHWIPEECRNLFI